MPVLIVNWCTSFFLGYELFVFFNQIWGEIARVYKKIALQIQLHKIAGPFAVNFMLSHIEGLKARL